MSHSLPHTVMSKPIVVVGSINLDLAVRAPRLPRPGETLLGTGFGVFTGGKGANQAVAAARLDHPTVLIGRLGDDPYADMLLRELRSAGVHSHALARVPGPSGVAVIVAAETGENSIVVAPGANERLTPQELNCHSSVIENAAVVLAQLEIPEETISALTAIVSRAGIPLILDPAPARALPHNVLESVEWITPNESEAQVLAGRSTPARTEGELRDLAECLLRLGPRNVLLKLGERGAYLASNNGARLMIPPYRVVAVDTTAAGDAFNAGFAVALARGACAAEAAHYASSVAAISVTRRGAFPSLPTHDEVAAFQAEHSEMHEETAL